MAAEFVRLVSTLTGHHRIGTGNFSKLVLERRAKQIECQAQRSTPKVDSLFHAPFHYYLVPFALSSKLWQARIDAPASLTSPMLCAGGPLGLAGFARTLNRAFRPLRIDGWLFGSSLDRIHSHMIDATGGPENSKRRRRGEMVFSVGTKQVLSPAPGDVPILLRRLKAALRTSQSALPLTCRLYAAFLICLIHPFADGNGRLMRAIAAAHDHPVSRTGSLCRAIAAFMQGRQRLWNFTLPLVLQGNSNALWDHFECCIHASARLVSAVDNTAQRYQAYWETDRSSIRNSADALLIANAVLTDQQFSRLRQGCSTRIRQLAEQRFYPVLFGDESGGWINSEAQHLASDFASTLIAQI